MPGSGVLHEIVTREGERLSVLVEAAGNRHLFMYDTNGLDVPARAILLESDEADQVAEILHSRPIVDRLRSLERRVDELIGELGP
ncbi:hypothetical protein [Mycobacterium hubeiense]|uniref:hypothetical protein n=1 Tax=Mycobacterium hubeiense TaxID=1867256 RepID=UPI001E29E73D|nr:hypothetical protein [Mycobacterium sp. QGD 101]